MYQKNSYFYIVSDSQKSKKLLDIFLKKISQLKDWIFDEKNYKYLFIFGGDGTLLKSLSKIKKNSRVILINGGNFGFFSSFDFANIDSLLGNIKNLSNYIKPLMLKATSNNEKTFSLNEVCFLSNHLFNFNIYINEILYEKFRGTGILISTPLGSTGRTKSIGGAIIFPSEKTIQMIEIEPLSQKGYRTLCSPLIMDYKSKIRIEINKFRDKYFYIYDGNTKEINEINEFSIECIKANFSLFYPNKIEHFIEKLKKKYISTE